jgi:hypothetical protein
VKRRTLELPMLLSVVFPTVAVCSQQADISGFFSNMYASSTTGDIGGATIFISRAEVNNGLEERYYAFVQTAEGVPTEPVLAPVSVNRDSITIAFTDGQYKDISPFRGRVTPDALIGSFSNGWGFRLPRMVIAKPSKRR